MSSFDFCERQLMSFVNHNYCQTHSDECSNVFFFSFALGSCGKCVESNCRNLQEFEIQ